MEIECSGNLTLPQRKIASFSGSPSSHIYMPLNLMCQCMLRGGESLRMRLHEKVIGRAKLSVILGAIMSLLALFSREYVKG